jgi:hypothetical protein
MNSAAIEPSHQWVSPNFINLEVLGTNYEMIRIQLKNEQGESKISLWEELNSGKNTISIDLSSLIKGAYSIIVSDTNGKVKLEKNIKL